MEEGNIVNRVAESTLVTINLEEYLPQQEIKVFDLKDYLYMGLILKEKDYRQALKDTDWEVFRDRFVAITCTADAIIPMWAYMLAAAYLQPLAADIFFGSEEAYRQHLLLRNIANINSVPYSEKRIVIKGCGEKPIPEAAYVEITKKLQPVAKSIMYGEPCSTVPIYKKK